MSFLINEAFKSQPYRRQLVLFFISLTFVLSRSLIFVSINELVFYINLNLDLASQLT